jgi:hypothetical protein
VPAAFGQSFRAGPGIAIAQHGAGADLGVYRQKKFWIVLYTAKTRDDAERKLREFGTQYGKLNIQQLQNQYGHFVVDAAVFGISFESGRPEATKRKYPRSRTRSSLSVANC